MYGIQGKGGPSEGRQESNRQVSFHQHLVGSFFCTKCLATRDQFHKHVFVKLFHKKIPIVQEDSEVISVFLRFWDLL